MCRKRMKSATVASSNLDVTTDINYLASHYTAAACARQYFAPNKIWVDSVPPARLGQIFSC